MFLTLCLIVRSIIRSVELQLRVLNYNLNSNSTRLIQPIVNYIFYTLHLMTLPIPSEKTK